MISRFSRPFLIALGIGIVGGSAAYGQAKPPAPLQPDSRSAEINRQRSTLLSGIWPVTDALLLHPPARDWLQWRRTYDEHGFSPLSEINKETVANLRSAWSWSLPAGTSEIVPRCMMASCLCTGGEITSRRSTPPPATCCGNMPITCRPARPGPVQRAHTGAISRFMATGSFSLPATATRSRWISDPAR
jgi:hypothetical protein